MKTICAFESVSWDAVVSLVIYLSSEHKGEFQSVSPGNHSKRISNISVAVTFIAEAMRSHLSRDFWEKQYMELHRTKFFITTFLTFRRGSSPAISNLNILVLKDDFSGFIELTPATAADRFLVADAIVQWYSRFSGL